MNISKYIDEYASKKRYYGLTCDAKTVHNLIIGDSEASLTNQEEYYESDYLAANIEQSVRKYLRDKSVAINIYKNFISFLSGKGITIDVPFPTITVSNSFERLMFISKYLQDPNHKVSDLAKVLWVSSRTIEDDLKKLRGLDDDPIQVCGKVYKISEIERGRDVVSFSSTAHPLFLTPNLTQVLVTLKGLKSMGENPLYAEYARLTATDIWEQLSDYAKERIRFVFSKLLPEDLEWYESLEKADKEYFYSEYRCSSKGNVFLDCMKNEKSFCVEYNEDGQVYLYDECVYIPSTYTGNSIDVKTPQGVITLYFEKIIRSAYTVEELTQI